MKTLHEHKQILTHFHLLEVQLHTLRRSMPYFSTVKDQAVATILEEDLELLVRECETYLRRKDQLSVEALESFEARSVTVLGEVKEFLLRNPKARYVPIQLLHTLGISP